MNAVRPTISSSSASRMLTFPTRQTDAPLADFRAIAVGQALDEVVGVGRLGRFDDLLHRRLETAVANVVGNRPGEEDGSCATMLICRRSGSRLTFARRARGAGGVHAADCKSVE